MSEFNLPKNEIEILRFWEKNRVFEKSLKARQKAKKFFFYDGPPFATGLPHYGHVLPGTIKDVVPRYQTMKGKYVERLWGWDCHGLPVEYEVEQESGISGKKQIEEIGIGKFNEMCRSIVLRYTKEWKEIIKRLGRWVDMDNAYKTMDPDYMESIWWVFKQLWDKKLIYKDFKSVSYCPRCSTPLSNFEVNQGYRDNVDDPSVFIKFKAKRSIPQCPNLYFLVWTTTPWTLPGNTALAISADSDYVVVKINGEHLILAKDRLSVIQDQYEIVKGYKGRELENWEYEPLFNFIKPDKKSWFVVSSSIVSMEDGTGIVHIAPSYGEEDFNLGKEKGLAFINTIDAEGKMVEQTPWKGIFIKKADPLIIKELESRGLMFRSERIKHTYPFCWRCDAPIYDYLWPSWFVNVSKIKSKLLTNNIKIKWNPEHIKTGRFGKWLEGARDWNISRNRYWGAPLPVWVCKECDNVEAIGSVEELEQKRYKKKNTFYLLRHGQSEKNLHKTVGSVVSSKLESDHYHLTELGRKQIEKVAKELQKQGGVDLILCSPFIRTQETAKIIADKLGIKIEKEPCLKEHDLGTELEGKKLKDYGFKDSSLKVLSQIKGDGETIDDVKSRMLDLVKELNNKYEGKKILLVTHGTPGVLLHGITENIEGEEFFDFGEKNYFKLGELRKIDFKNYPYSSDGKFDLHRPYIDEISLKCSKCGKEMKRTSEVFDCWFESGSMPYAQKHYPFDKNNFDPKEKIGFPADFIAEGLDQTRGWFYTMHIIATALFNQQAFNNVIVNGMVLAEDGKKMSKRLKNYPEPTEMISRHGSDALRLYLLSSPAIAAENLLFSEKSLIESSRDILTILNVLKFYQTYKGKTKFDLKFNSKIVLDRWMNQRLNDSIINITEMMDNYDISGSLRATKELINDISTWYLRRSRERFHTKESKMVCQNLAYVLLRVSQILAPFVPFVSEFIYQELKNDFSKKQKLPISVHLTDWPNSDLKPDKNILLAMDFARNVSALGLAIRKKVGIKVRQPLKKLEINNQKIKIDDGINELIKDELNIKEIEYRKQIEEGINIFSMKQNDLAISINIELDDKLKAEGWAREFVRQIQDARKEAKFAFDQKVNLYWQTEDEELRRAINYWARFIKEKTILKAMEQKDFKNLDIKKEFELGVNRKIWFGLKK